MSEPQEALAQQIGGDHYKKGIQPFEISLANGHDACTHAMIKYLTRHRRNAPEKGYEGCMKAHHIASIRVETIAKYGLTRTMGLSQIDIQDYVNSNELCHADAAAVYLIEAWHERANADHGKWRDRACHLIRKTAEQAYPHLFKKEDFV